MVEGSGFHVEGRVRGSGFRVYGSALGCIRKHDV
jgi:hypothetical protein